MKDTAKKFIPRIKKYFEQQLANANLKKRRFTTRKIYFHRQQS